MSFRLWTIFYVFALFAAAMATFGVGGIFAALVVLGFWAWAISVPKSVLPILLFVLIVGMLLALLFPAIGAVRASAYSASCSNNLRQLSMALNNYRMNKGSLPPAYAVDSSGRPTLSWRVLILPRIDRGDIFDLLDRSKPWDDPANAPNFNQIDLYQCPKHFSTAATTDYFAVVGPHTAWPGEHGRPASEFTDSPGDTLLLIECGGRNVHWAEPRDLSFDEAVDLLTKPIAADDGHPINHGFFYKPSFARHVAFADGNVAELNGPISRELAIAILTVDGGEIIDRGEFERAFEPQLDYGKCYAFGVFVVLSLLPLVKLFRQSELGEMDDTIPLIG